MLATGAGRDYEQAVILNVILGSLASLSLGLLLWQWLVARRFPLHRRSADLRFGSNLPNGSSAFQLSGVTLLKPLKGADENMEMCLRSWLTQNYAGPVQTLFGVATADDPAVAVVRKLLAEFPQADAQLVVCPEQLGANAKVAKLIQLERLVKHEFICVSDADVRVPADFLAEAVISLAQGSPKDLGRTKIESPGQNLCPPQIFGCRDGAAGNTALVNCFYRLANPTTLAMQCEAVAINADFWSQVLQSCALKPMDFSLGAAMVTRRAELAGIGGFEAIKDCLADDYQMGNRIAKRGGRIEICPVVVECWDAPMGWAAMWKHQLRWARTIRVCQPGPYFFSILSNPTFWAVLWAAVSFNGPALIFLGVALVVRWVVTADLQRRLAGEQFKIQNSKFKMECPPPHVGGYGNGFWLAPVKDILQVAVWALAFAGNTIEWRGRRMKLRRDGTLVPA